jgi:hypothetical protein
MLTRSVFDLGPIIMDLAKQSPAAAAHALPGLVLFRLRVVADAGEVRHPAIVYKFKPSEIGNLKTITLKCVTR